MKQTSKNRNLNDITVFLLALKVRFSLDSAVILALGLVQGQPDPLARSEFGQAHVGDDTGHILVLDEDPLANSHGGHLDEAGFSIQSVVKPLKQK